MKHICSVALLLILFTFPSDARADVAPPIFPPGSNPQPGAEITQVRMAAEMVIIEVSKDITPQSLPKLIAHLRVGRISPTDRFGLVHLEEKNDFL